MGAKLDVRYPNTNHTLLQKWILDAHLENIEFLLQNGALVNDASNAEQDTCLHMGIRWNTVPEYYELLLKYGADCTLKNAMVCNMYSDSLYHIKVTLL